MIVEGTVLRGPTFEPVEGRVVVDDGTITAIEEARVGSDDIVLPAFVNAHTHLGDAIAKEAGEGLDLEALVAPPDGLKHRLLADASPTEMVTAIRRTLSFMAAGGTTACLDFREGGVEGVRTLQRAAADAPLTVRALGRESIEAMEIGDGFGASGANDADFETERAATRRADKRFGIHAGEANSSDLDPALDLEPDFLVHVVHPTDRHLQRIAATDTPVVVCPRSNLVTGVGLPPIRDLLDATSVALGTDNVMLNAPDMFREMEFVAKLTDATSREVLAMATTHGAAIAETDAGTIEVGREARLLVLDGDSDNLAGARNPVRAVVRRAGIHDVVDTYYGSD